MKTKSKLYVFAKFEIVLIFLFMFFIAISSFTFGLKIGKGKMCGTDGIAVSEEDKSNVQAAAKMLSKQEEMVNDVVSKEEEEVSEEEEDDYENVKGSVQDRLKKEVDKLIVHGGFKNETENESSADSPEAEAPEKADIPKDIKNDKYTGKYTIQLGAYRTMKEAEQFAEGFRIRGYNPIISQGENNGIWYRVSLEAFDTASKAKDYILKERSLFQGENYVIRQFE